MNRMKKLLNKMYIRVKQTTKRDNQQTLLIVLTAFIIANVIAIITAIGLPTGPGFYSRLLDVLLAISLNVLGFVLFVAIISIFLSLLFIPLPRLLVSAIIYNGLLFGIILYEANAGMSFSIFIGVITTSLSLGLGYLLIYLMKIKMKKRVLFPLIALVAFTLVIFNYPSKTTLEIKDTISNPAEVGSYETEFFTYGSGSDKHRDVFGSDVAEETLAVDASHFITDWSDEREAFWDFDPTNFPLNGRVWMPKGEGDFPLILMVHGNHTMENFSTDGYDYLGELLASHGFTFISVDEDYVNYSNFVGEPNDNYRLRSWLLLKHLTQLKELNQKDDSKFYQKLNFDKVALAGHSRGGQAAAMAANYENFFDDENLYNNLSDINIKAVAALAPTDKLIDNKRANLNNIAYMVIQGSKDSDIYDFRGNKQFHRTNLSPNSNLFKTAVYLENANHVQFNTSWGQNDFSLPRGMFLDRFALINKRDQQFITQAYFTSFFKKVFHDDPSYDGLFQNPQSYIAGLSDTQIISQYKTNGYQSIKHFNKSDELNSGLNGFDESEIITPRGRSDKKHPKDVLKLAWSDEASYSVELTPTDLKGIKSDNADYISVTLANNLPESTPDIELTIASRNEIKMRSEASLTEVVEISNTTLGLFDRFFREGKYEESWEPVFETIEMPIEEFQKVSDEKLNLTIHFKGDKGDVLLEEIGVN